MVTTILPDPRVKRSKFNFSEHGQAAYQIKWNHDMQQHCSKYFACRPPSLTLWMRSTGQESTSLEHGHVA